MMENVHGNSTVARSSVVTIMKRKREREKNPGEEDLVMMMKMNYALFLQCLAGCLR
jgi:hypothetical protein